MTTSKRWARWLVLLALGVAAPASAQTQAEQARALFSAGVTAYRAGDFLAAAQAFEKAHQVSPRPGLLFSTGQALRRQYVASGEPQHARLALKYYRQYLDEVKSGGRRLEATRAVSELLREVGEGEGGAMVSSTRLMVTSPLQKAVVQVDGGQVRSLPFNEEIEPGKHSVRVMASGYRTAEREIVAQEGDIVPLDLALEGKPPLLAVEGADGADVKVDGKLVGEAPFAKPLALSPGSHFVTIEDPGYEAYGQELEFDHGSETTIAVDLPATNQRRAAYGILATGGVFMVGAAVQAGLAFAVQREAVKIEEAREVRNITEEERQSHNDSIVLRDRLATSATLAGGVGLVVLTTGFLLYLFDEPEISEPAPSLRERESEPEQGPEEPEPDTLEEMEMMGGPIVTPGFWGVGMSGRF